MAVDGVRPVATSPRDLTISLEGLTVCLTRRTARSVIPQHYHERANIGLCLRGVFQETVGRQDCRITPAAMVIRPAGDPHANRYGAEPAKCLIVELRPDGHRLLEAASNVCDRPRIHESEFVATTAIRLHAELRVRDDWTPLAVESMLANLLVHVGRREREACRRGPTWLDDVVAILQQSVSPPAGLASLAREVGVHPSHLAREFRRRFGCTAGEFGREQRLDRAAGLVRTSETPLAEIAIRTGFVDQSHLSRAFRCRFGMAPGQFRRART